MKKKLISIVLLLALLIPCLTACHGSKETNSFDVPAEFDTERNYEITFWAKNDTNITQTTIYENSIKNFEKLYPNIKVNLRLYTDYNRIYNDVITNIATQTTPNVCITYPDHIATYLTGENTVVSLNDLISNSKYGLGGSELKFDSPNKDEIVPKFLSECVLDGSCYALPFVRSTEACYINKTYVEALGFTLPEVLTWDFVWEVSEAATKKDADGNYIVNGQKVMLPFIYKSTDNMMICYLRQQNAEYSDESGKIMLFNDTTEKLLYEISGHVEAGAFSTFKFSGYPANFLNAGQCIFAIDSTAGATWMGSDAPLVDIAEESIVNFETVVMTIPQSDTENPTMISQGPSLCVFNKEDPQEVLASWLFCQYLLTNDVQIPYAQTEGYVPVTIKAQNSAVYKDYLSKGGDDNNFYYDIKIKATQLLIDNVENTFVTPVFNGSASLRNAAGQLIENVTKSVKRKEKVDDAYMKNLYKDIQSLYRLNMEGENGGNMNSSGALGPLPAGSVILLCSLALVWVLMAIYAVIQYKKRKKSP